MLIPLILVIVLSFNILGGVIFNKVFDYDIVTYYTNNPSFDLEPDVEIKLGISVRFGSTISYKIIKNITLNASPFADINLVLNSIDYQSDYLNIPDNRFSIGLKIGVEYRF